MRRLSGFILAALTFTPLLVLGGCGRGHPIRYYTLQLPPAPEASASVYPVTLLIGRMEAPAILEDEPIVYRTGPNEIDTYPYHLWVEPPVRLVKNMLIRRLRASGKFRAVAELGSAMQGDYVLQGKLYDFEEVNKQGMEALVNIEFELLDRKTRSAVWTHYYSRSEPVQGKQIADVVAALDGNLARCLGEVAAGLDAYFSANLSRWAR